MMFDKRSAIWMTTNDSNSKVSELRDSYLGSNPPLSKNIDIDASAEFILMWWEVRMNLTLSWRATWHT